ncbi:MAG: hypothetical protein JWP48_5375 [Actinoallomurus sp.]|jgi:hypothetical protein|nr:hypothetical protein [Actinoallomurus sp.]
MTTTSAKPATWRKSSRSGNCVETKVTWQKQA